MALVLFLLAFLILAVWIGFAGGTRPEPWRRWVAVAVGTSLPLQIWLVMCLRDAIVLGYGFRLETESSRFGFYVGLSLAAWAMPLWLLASAIGCWLGIRSGRRQV